MPQGVVSQGYVLEEAAKKVSAVENFACRRNETKFASVEPVERFKAMKALAQLSSALGWISDSTHKDLKRNTIDRSPTRPLEREAATTAARRRFTSREAECRNAAAEPPDERLREPMKHYNSPRDVDDLRPDMAKIQLQHRGYSVSEADDPKLLLRRVTGCGQCSCGQAGLHKKHEHIQCLMVRGELRGEPFSKPHFKFCMTKEELIRHVDSARRVLCPLQAPLCHVDKKHGELHEMLCECVIELRKKLASN